MRPVRSFRWDRNVTERKQGVYIAISVGPIAHLGETETLQREIERLQSHIGETEIPIGDCRCQNRRISGRGSRSVRLRLMVTGGKGHNVYPSSGPLDGGKTLLLA